MSSSVSAALIVQQNLERERLMLLDRRAELARLLSEARRLCDQARAAKCRLGETFPELISRDPIFDQASETISEADGSIANVRHWLETERQRLEGALAIHEVQRILATVAARADQEATQAVRDRHQRVAAALSRLAAGVPEPNLEALIEYATGIEMTVEPGRFAGQLLDLKLRVQAQNDRQQQVVVNAQLAEALIDELHGLSGPGLDDLRAELHRVAAREVALRPALPREVAALAASLREEADRRYAAGVLAEELARLGYEVGPAFEVALARGGKLQMTRAELGEYRVEIEASGGRQSFRSELSRPGVPGEALSDRQAQRDKVMQETWCEDLNTAFKRAAGRGVRSSVNHYVPAGAKPVRVTPARVQIQKKKGRERQLRSDGKGE